MGGTAGRGGAPSGWHLVPTLGLIYVASQFYRTANAVIAPDLMRELSLGPEAMGALTGAFYIAFAAVQIPLGILLDRYGPRATNLGLLAIAIVGAVVFAESDGMLGLTVGRVLMGVGCAGVLMGSIMVFMRWFPADRLATATAVMVATGGLGVLLATSPLGVVATAIGWRTTFHWTAVFTALLIVLTWAVVRDAPPGHAYHGARRESLSEVVAGLGPVLRHPAVKYLFVMQLASLSSVFTVLALWGGPYLADVHGLDTVARGNVLLAMSVASIVGNLIYGPLDRILDTRKGLVMVGGAITTALFALLAVLDGPPLWLAALILVGIGLIGSSTIVIHAQSRGLFPDHMVGRGLTVLNMAVMLGVALGQIVSGMIVGAFEPVDGVRPEIAYRLTFAYVGGFLGLALLAYARVPDVKPSRQMAAASGAT